MTKTISANKMYWEYYHIHKVNVPTYRLGQHICNTMNLDTTTLPSPDLFVIQDDNEADKVFWELVERFQWDIYELPIFER
ncbi:hypothetical protein NVP1170O_079 [Vibrio phage 1.170.O._10N.261.52.C3]|nr:hypothetical protein NVP1170O_079 [Vibrio phage 1.170.O._10N.261.52.C3]